MNIRLAQDKDYAPMARLHRQTIRHVNSKDYAQDIIKVWSGRTKAERFRSSASKCKRWVAISKNKLIGFCDHPLAGNEIWGLYVHKDAIGIGVGSMLLNVAENSLRKQGCKKIMVKSTITAKEFYRKQEYKVIKKSVHIIEGKEVPIFILSKVLR